MTDEPMPRFMVRQGTRGFMVWDRETKRPAMFDGRPAVVLTEEQATAIKDKLLQYYGEQGPVGEQGR
jgi:hypothetical protein